MSLNKTKNLAIQQNVDKKFWPVVAALFIIYSAVSFFILKDFVVGGIQLVNFIILTSSMLISLKRNNTLLASNIISPLVILSLNAWLITGGPAGVGFWWSIVHAIGCFLGSTRRWGLIWLIVHVIVSFIVVVFSLFGFFSIAYSIPQLLNILLAYIVAGFLVYSFAKVRDEVLQLSEDKEKQLEENNEKFFKIFNSLGLAVLLSKKDGGTIVDVNDQFIKLFGFDNKEEIIGKTGAELKIIDPETRTKIVEEIKLKGEITNREFRLKRKDGIDFWSMHSVRYITLTGIEYLLIVNIDVTERIELEEQIKKLVDFQDVILNGTDYSIITTSAKDGLITSFNKGAEQMLGYKAEEIIGKFTPAIILNKAEVEAIAKPMAEELNMQGLSPIELIRMKVGLSNATTRFETIYMHKNGSQIQIELSLSALRDKENNILGYLNVAKNIFEIKRVKDELEKTKIFFLTVFEKNPLPMLLRNEETKKIEFVNSTFCEHYGYTSEDLIGKKIEDLDITDPSDLENITLMMKIKGYVRNYERFIWKKNGDKILVLFSLEIVDIDNKQYSLTSFHDIQNRKELEIKLEAARDAAEKSNKLKDVFLANMSHEIRTPMNSILGYTDLLLKKNLPIIESEYAQAIKSSGENLLRIVNDILDYSKIESGILVFEDQPISIKEIFISLHAMLSNKSKEKNIHLSFDYENSLPDVVIGDPVRTTQILLNIINNAIKFTHKGSVYVFAKVNKEEKDEHQIEFSIKDTGIGIEEDKLRYIFERFRQADSSTTRNYGGTGLGLSIAKQLVELQGGKIGVESKINIGSVFTIILPFKKQIKFQLINIKNLLILTFPIY